MVRSFVAVLLIAVVVHAQSPAPTRSLTVSGTGTAKAPASTLYVTFELSAVDESAPEALKKFTARLRLLEKTVEGLETKNVQIERGVSKFGMKRMDQNGMIMEVNGRNGEKAPEFEVSEKLSVKLADVDKLDQAARLTTATGIVDALAQAGLIKRAIENPYEYRFAAVNMAGGVIDVQESKAENREFILFDLVNTKTIETEATKEAVADARKNAAEMAQMVGVKVGKVLRVTPETAQRHWSKSAGECSFTTGVQIEFEITD